MKSVSVTHFKAHCLEFLNQVALTGQSMILTKRGKPTAMVSPPPPDASRRWIPGQFKDQGKIVGDIVAPFDEPWEAASDPS
jgi:prevent-host-death family protein